MKTQFKELGLQPVVIRASEINEDEFTIIHYISTPTPDRYGDIVEQAGLDDTKFKNNPVVLFGHRSRELPIGKSRWVKSDGVGVLAQTAFDKDSEFAREIFRMNKEGILNAWSIGFIPLEYSFLKEGGMLVKKWELLEYSSVPIPANPDALNLMMKECKVDMVRDIINDENKLMRMELAIKDLSGKEEKFNEKIELIRKDLISLEDRIAKKLIEIINVN